MENINQAVMNLSSVKIIPDLVTDGVRRLWSGIRGNLNIKNLPGECWVKCSDCYGVIYVSNFMRVKHVGLKTHKILSQILNGEGYWQVRFTKNGRRIGKRVHRLYSMAFMSNPQCKKYINHKNLNREDNIPLNIEWCSELENTLHAKINGAIPQGEAVKQSKLTSSQVLEIYNSKKTNIELQSIYGVSKRAIYKIKSGISWGSVTGGVPVYNKRTYDDNLVKSIYLDNRTPKEISNTYKVPLSVVCRILKRETYKSVTDGLSK